MLEPFLVLQLDCLSVTPDNIFPLIYFLLHATVKSEPKFYNGEELVCIITSAAKQTFKMYFPHYLYVNICGLYILYMDKV